MTTQQIVKPEELAKIAEAAMAEPTVEIDTVTPPSPEVILPGGFVDFEGNIIRTVEVRELNGEDEEAIARSSTASKALNTILMRGAVSLGDREITKDDFDKLLTGDRESILLGIRKVTFGNEIDFAVTCSGCSTRQDVTVDLETDVPVTVLDNPIDDRTWDITLKNGDVANVSLPTGKTQRKLVDAPDDTTGAELNSILLNSCINSINGNPAKPNVALKLGLVDREKITREIVDRTPGPRLSEVSKVCEACGESMAIPLNLAALFRF